MNKTAIPVPVHLPIYCSKGETCKQKEKPPNTLSREQKYFYFSENMRHSEKQAECWEYQKQIQVNIQKPREKVLKHTEENKFTQIKHLSFSLNQLKKKSSTFTMKFLQL